MTTVQQLIDKLKKQSPNATVMLGGMRIDGDDIEVEEEGEQRERIVWLT